MFQTEIYALKIVQKLTQKIEKYIDKKSAYNKQGVKSSKLNNNDFTSNHSPVTSISSNNYALGKTNFEQQSDSFVIMQQLQSISHWQRPAVQSQQIFFPNTWAIGVTTVS